jgi:hypothetical protein
VVKKLSLEKKGWISFGKAWPLGLVTFEYLETWLKLVQPIKQVGPDKRVGCIFTETKTFFFSKNFKKFQDFLGISAS